MTSVAWRIQRLVYRSSSWSRSPVAEATGSSAHQPVSATYSIKAEFGGIQCKEQLTTTIWATPRAHKPCHSGLPREPGLEHQPEYGSSCEPHSAAAGGGESENPLFYSW